MPQSSVRSYFKELSSGNWELQIPEDPASRASHRWPIGFVTTGFVRGRLVYIILLLFDSQTLCFNHTVLLCS